MDLSSVRLLEVYPEIGPWEKGPFRAPDSLPAAASPRVRQAVRGCGAGSTSVLS